MDHVEAGAAPLNPRRVQTVNVVLGDEGNHVIGETVSAKRRVKANLPVGRHKQARVIERVEHIAGKATRFAGYYESTQNQASLGWFSI